ncbi:MAG: M48 family metallopeptidase [Clostridiales bacterium]|nr:M48 family metallopeptidase [Clostridiales bacterium]
MGSLRIVSLDGRPAICEFEQKRVKNINVRVRDDGTLYCSYPRYVSQAEAERFVSSAADYLSKSIDKVVARQEKAGKPVKYCEGENIRVLGREVTLHILQGKKNEVEVIGGDVNLTVKDPEDNAQIKRTYDKWRRASLKRVVLLYCHEVYPHFAGLGVKYPEKIAFGEYKSFWGECFPSKSTLKFSLRLFEQREDLIEYVVVHEFSHFLELNHSKRFWAQVERLIPDWRERRKRLNGGREE